MTQQLSTNTFGTAKWVVSADATAGTHTTIAGALSSASSGDTIFIRPGTYTENLTLKAGVNVVAYVADAFTPNVTIVGKCTATFAGSASLSGIRLQTNSDNFLAVTGSSATIINLNECYLNCADNTGITYSSSSSSSAVNIYYCKGNIATTGIAVFAHSASGTLTMFSTDFSNTGASTTASTVSAGTFTCRYCRLRFPVSSSGTGGYTISSTIFNNDATNTTCVTFGGTGTNNVSHGLFTSGSASALVVNSNNVGVDRSIVNSTNASTISGSGSLQVSDLVYAHVSSADTCTVSNFVKRTQLVGKIFLGNEVMLLSGSGSPNGSITAPKGSLYMRTDGSSSTTRMYTNTNSGTSWTAVTTSS